MPSCVLCASLLFLVSDWFFDSYLSSHVSAHILIHFFLYSCWKFVICTFTKYTCMAWSLWKANFLQRLYIYIYIYTSAVIIFLIEMCFCFMNSCKQTLVRFTHLQSQFQLKFHTVPFFKKWSYNQFIFFLYYVCQNVSTLLFGYREI